MLEVTCFVIVVNITSVDRKVRLRTPALPPILAEMVMVHHQQNILQVAMDQPSNPKTPAQHPQLGIHAMHPWQAFPAI